MHISPFSCFFFFIINRLFAALCSWLITCFTVIRFINIFQRLNTIRSNIILVICLTIIFSIANSYLIVTLDYHRGEELLTYDNFSIDTNDYSHNSTRCFIRPEYHDDPLTLFLNIIVAGFLNLVLPSMLTFIVNIAIVCYIKRVYETQICEYTGRRSDNSGASYRSTRSTLLFISITYTLCYLPYCIIQLLLIPFGDIVSTLYEWTEIAFILRYISHSINFYAYIFTSQRFRRDIILLFRNLYRPCLYMKERNRRRKKTIRERIALHHYQFASVPSPDTVETKLPSNPRRLTLLRLPNQNL
ncbi:unnamed protein product [Adineta steineri]|uniref:G-protein coupled receptors family 1 profile domain-containing protein n=1 Tax=Adineta steineri TaxID=433720 RepID=A0A813RCW0_9BILA|nr:unnamed protein product [Adineta steineri]CAF0922442.1 unnamed protein product [Adineta steineri]